MPIAALLEIIALLFAALLAPASMLVRVSMLDARALKGFAHMLRRMQARGRALRYAGEDDETVARRIDRMAWIARDPHAALKHLVRRCRGLARHMFAMAAPPSFSPPLIVAHLTPSSAAPPAPCDDTS